MKLAIESKDQIYFLEMDVPKKAMLCEKESYQREIRLINGPRMISGWTCGGNRCPLYGHCDK